MPKLVHFLVSHSAESSPYQLLNWVPNYFQLFALVYVNIPDSEIIIHLDSLNFFLNEKSIISIDATWISNEK